MIDGHHHQQMRHDLHYHESVRGQEAGRDNGQLPLQLCHAEEPEHSEETEDSKIPRRPENGTSRYLLKIEVLQYDEYRINRHNAHIGRQPGAHVADRQNRRPELHGPIELHSKDEMKGDVENPEAKGSICDDVEDIQQLPDFKHLQGDCDEVPEDEKAGKGGPCKLDLALGESDKWLQARVFCELRFLHPHGGVVRRRGFP
mmetsp:Transcript_6315/g.14416  ORF Transcript_6315/g.14416 Transcript_6315/m.14416 type:complete len:201 (+) Transcript_6315:1252-1854(+)